MNGHAGYFLLRDRFPLGCTVQLSALWRERFAAKPHDRRRRDPARTATVVGYGRQGRHVWIQFTGSRSRAAYHVDFVERTDA